MTERKVLNKYYPPDFDPSKLPRIKRERGNAVFEIRIMAPFNMRCNNCGEYIYKGKKFNSRKEDVPNERYLGLYIYRFYIKCPRCVSEIAFKTDPENADYKLEAGATRNFEALRTAEILAKKEVEKAKDEEDNNPMKVLENRTKASQKEMENLEILEEIRDQNARHAKLSHEEMLEIHKKYGEQLSKLQKEEDEKFINSIFQKKSVTTIRRLNDDSNDNSTSELHCKKLKLNDDSKIISKDTIISKSGSINQQKKLIGLIKKKNKKEISIKSQDKVVDKLEISTTPNAIVEYGCSSDSN